MSAIQRQLLSLALAVSFLGNEALFAQDKAIENLCTLKVNGSQFTLKYMVAFADDDRTVLLATGQKLSADTINRIKEEDADDSIGGILDQNYLKLAFQADGEITSLCGNVDGSIFFKSSVSGNTPATIADGRLKGELKLVEEGRFAKDFLVKFNLPIDAQPTADQPVKLDPPVKVSVAGKFTGEGKPSNLKFLTVRVRESFGGKEAISLIFTEKDPTTSKDPTFDASFRKLGNALVLSVDLTGGIFGCEVIHSAHSKGPFSAVGEIKMVEFDLSTGNVLGHVSTNGVRDAFKQKWEVDLKFAAPLPETMRKAMSQIQPVAKATKPENRPAGGSTIAPKTTPAKPNTPLIAAQSLPLPADAKNVQYKQVVKHIAFESGLPVAGVAQEFSAKLKAQGWKEEAGGLMGQKNAILKRANGAAKLTIMIQPMGTGSQVKIFTEGLDWESGAGEAKPAQATDDLSKEIEKKAQDLIKKTFKDLPPGFLDEEDK